MSPESHPRAFRVHFQRLVLSALIRGLEADEGSGRRRRRAAEEAARLREVLASLGSAPIALGAGETVSSRVAAYTYGPEVALRPQPLRLPAGPGADTPAERAAAPPAGRMRTLRLVWIACAAALPVALVWRGVDSTVSAVADVALILATLALFAVSLRQGTATWAGGERRSGADRRIADVGPPHSGRERRSGVDRRLDAPPAASTS
jgi:hypothetical protein